MGGFVKSGAAGGMVSAGVAGVAAPWFWFGFGKGSAMKVLITINCGNSAFESGDEGREVARILRALALRAETVGDLSGGFGPSLFDVNGNRVGDCEVNE